MIERSNAIKCPWIGLHLANTKKVQQRLAEPGVVERYLDSESVTKVRRTFAGMWGLETSERENVQGTIEVGIRNNA